MANPGVGEKDQMATENPSAVANSKPSKPRGRPHTSKTESQKPADDLATIADMLRSWAGYAEEAGVQVMTGEQDGTLLLAIPGLTIDADGQIVPAERTTFAQPAPAPAPQAGGTQ